jgi:Uma2 family endonuclease
MRAHLMRTAFTEHEYFAMVDAALEKSEFIDGMIYGLAERNDRHALVGANVLGTIGNRLRGGRCRAFSSDLRIWSPAYRAYVYPDATVVCGPVEKSDQKGDRLSVKNPVVVVEVVSPGSEDYDRNDKVAIYKAIPTVRDYLIVDPYERTVEHHARDEDGSWRFSVVSQGEVPLVGVSIALPLTEVFADLDLR